MTVEFRMILDMMPSDDLITGNIQVSNGDRKCFCAELAHLSSFLEHTIGEIQRMAENKNKSSFKSSNLNSRYLFICQAEM
jgi:hypothetical protein